MGSYVIGDIHGCLDELARLVDQLPLEPNDRLIFLGDYIDRGPDSKGVVSYLLRLRELAAQEVVFLKGNHEDMFLSYLGLPGQYGEMFFYNGGQATLASYGVPTSSAPIDEVLTHIPPAHIEFFKNLDISWVIEPFLCVHAGVHPNRPLHDQIESDLLWIRHEFIYNSHRFPYTILYGHTPQNEVLFDLPYKIGLDTGLVYGNKLSCLEVEEKVLFQIDRGKKFVNRTSIKNKWNQTSSGLAP